MIGADGSGQAERIIAILTSLLGRGEYQLVLTCLAEPGWPGRRFGTGRERDCAVDVLRAAGRYDALADITAQICNAEGGAALAEGQLVYLLWLAVVYIGDDLSEEVNVVLGEAIMGLGQRGSERRIAQAGRHVADALRQTT